MPQSRQLKSEFSTTTVIPQEISRVVLPHHLPLGWRIADQTPTLPDWGPQHTASATSAISRFPRDQASLRKKSYPRTRQIRARILDNALLNNPASEKYQMQFTIYTISQLSTNNREFPSCAFL